MNFNKILMPLLLIAQGAAEGFNQNSYPNQDAQEAFEGFNQNSCPNQGAQEDAERSSQNSCSGIKEITATMIRCELAKGLGFIEMAEEFVKVHGPDHPKSIGILKQLQKKREECENAEDKYDRADPDCKKNMPDPMEFVMNGAGLG